jgi:hypothetical protein
VLSLPRFIFPGAPRARYDMVTAKGGMSSKGLHRVHSMSMSSAHTPRSSLSLPLSLRFSRTHRAPAFPTTQPTAAPTQGLGPRGHAQQGSDDAEPPPRALQGLNRAAQQQHRVISHAVHLQEAFAYRTIQVYPIDWSTTTKGACVKRAHEASLQSLSMQACRV